LKKGALGGEWVLQSGQEVVREESIFIFRSNQSCCVLVRMSNQKRWQVALLVVGANASGEGIEDTVIVPDDGDIGVSAEM
jgi:hypothetical protein